MAAQSNIYLPTQPYKTILTLILPHQEHVHSSNLTERQISRNYRKPPEICRFVHPWHQEQSRAPVSRLPHIRSAHFCYFFAPLQEPSHISNNFETTSLEILLHMIETLYLSEITNQHAAWRAYHYEPEPACRPQNRHGQKHFRQAHPLRSHDETQ